MLAGYEDAAVGPGGVPTGPVRIQHVYDVGAVSAEPGDVVYLAMEQATLPARRLHLWNAPTDDQVTVIYKVRNETDEPLAEGVVRSYEDGLFIGSDLIELTPVGSEGSVTVGQLQDVRVEPQRDHDRGRPGCLRVPPRGRPDDQQLRHRADRPRGRRQLAAGGRGLHLLAEPARESGNVLRWEVTVEPGEEEVIEYSFRVD